MSTESPLPTPSAVVNLEEKNGNGEAVTLAEDTKPVNGAGDAVHVEDEFEMGLTKEGGQQPGLENGQTGLSEFAADVPPDGGYVRLLPSPTPFQNQHAFDRVGSWSALHSSYKPSLWDYKRATAPSNATMYRIIPGERLAMCKLPLSRRFARP